MKNSSGSKRQIRTTSLPKEDAVSVPTILLIIEYMHVMERVDEVREQPDEDQRRCHDPEISEAQTSLALNHAPDRQKRGGDHEKRDRKQQDASAVVARRPRACRVRLIVNPERQGHQDEKKRCNIEAQDDGLRNRQGQSSRDHSADGGCKEREELWMRERIRRYGAELVPAGVVRALTLGFAKAAITSSWQACHGPRRRQAG